ncbi:MAG: hypothetical protein IJ121_03605 [Eubacterium sp.]|nr:hypothetical protein [Eubacterium sp.]
MRAVGAMEMPVNFRYRDVFLKGKPQHDRFDPFRIRHPGMERRRRAKIFAPFDALKGFNEAIAAMDIRCAERYAADYKYADRDRADQTRADQERVNREHLQNF